MTLEARLAERERALTAFLEAERALLARCCHELARAFARGGTLLAVGSGSAETDAAHVAVEFMHPVIVGKRALPALAPPNDVAALARAGDVALGIEHHPGDPAVAAFLRDAADRGLLTILFTAGASRPGADFVFAVPSDDPAVVQEIQETAYHVLWELVHVFFEHPGLLEETCVTCGDVGVPGRVVEVHGRTAVVDVEGAREEIAIDLLQDGVAEGDSVLCHAGVALQRLS